MQPEESEPATVSDWITQEAARTEIQIVTDLLTEWYEKRLSTVYVHKNFEIAVEYDEAMSWYIIHVRLRLGREMVDAFSQVRNEQIEEYATDTKKWSQFLDRGVKQVVRDLKGKSAGDEPMALYEGPLDAMRAMGQSMSAASASLMGLGTSVAQFSGVMKDTERRLMEIEEQKARDSIMQAWKKDR